jgi:hypothetical protein
MTDHLQILFSNRYIFRSYDLKMVIRPKHVAVTEYNIQSSVALDGNPEPVQGLSYKATATAAGTF